MSGIDDYFKKRQAIDDQKRQWVLIQVAAFSVFFVCIAITSDIVCYLFIPVQWLFFAASTYVWVQYVWHTERGICLPTVSLWLLFVYVEASVRLRELKTLPFNLDLCRPFAAHCIGYPMVTLGFGFKSYVSYRMRLRRQREVQKENDGCNKILQQALPAELQNSNNTYVEKQKALSVKADEEVISNGVGGRKSPRDDDKELSKKQTSKLPEDEDAESEYIEQSLPKQVINDFDDSPEIFPTEQQTKTFKVNGVAKTPSNKLNSAKENSSKKGKNYSKDLKEISSSTFSNNKDESTSRLENDIKRLKSDLQFSRNMEQDLRSQISTLGCNDKSMKSELYKLQQDNESLQNKLHNLVTSRQQDKQNLIILERRLQEERKLRAATDQLLSAERKAKKAEEAAAARAVALANAARGECTDSCKLRRRETENDIKQLRRDLKQREDQYRHIEHEVLSLRQLKETQADTEVLMLALNSFKDKNTHLEKSLSAETRLKMDLFSALGAERRQVEIHKSLLARRDGEINDLKSKIGEVMALVPASISSYNGVNTESSPLYSTKSSLDHSIIQTSNLNPHASDYTPSTTI